VADNHVVRVCHHIAYWSLAVSFAVGIFLCSSPRASATSLGPTCGQKTFNSPNGVSILVLFANNGTVQRYEVTAGADNTELVNDARDSVEKSYGPAGLNAPPLHIISYRPAEAGSMMLPDKAVDSCGRTLSFN